MGLSDATRGRLEMQGFACRVDPSIAEVAPWLRVTPALSTVWILVGTLAGSHVVLWLFAAVSGFASTQRVHPFDRLSNAIRARGDDPDEPLPENPAPRRFAMALAAAWSAATGALFALGLRTAGFVSGAALSLAGLAVASIHFCVGSWIYQRLTAPPTRP